MTIRHHPSATLRGDFASGALAPGAALAVATHIKRCPVCAAAVESMSGNGERPVPAGGLAAPPSRSFARRAAVTVAKAAAAAEPDETWRAGRWRFMGPGLRIADLQGVSGLGEAAYLLKASSRARLRLDRGVEQLLVLEGGLRAGDSVYESGDLLELGGQPMRGVSDPKGGCTLLIVSEDAWPSSRLLRFLLGLGRREGV